MKEGLFGKLSKLFGAPGESAADGRELAPFKPSSPAAPAAPRVPAAARLTDDLPTLYRSEIIDERKRLCGYLFYLKFLQRSRPMSESLFFEVMQSAGVPGFASRRLAVIPVDPENMDVDRYGVFNGPTSFLQIDLRKTMLEHDDLVSQLLAIRKTGARIALSGVSMNRTELQYLKAAHMVFLTMSEYPLAQFQKILRHIHAMYPDIAVVVDQVGSWPEYRMCMAWGVKYCLGEFMTTLDVEEARDEIDHGQLIAIEMLNLLRSEGDLNTLGEVAKKDPAITFKLLGWANSPANGLATTITSLPQAITILGRDELYRWLTVSMFRMGANPERNESVLEIALARARLMETLPAEGLAKAQRDELFLVGLFSLFDVLLEVPMAQVMNKVKLPEQVADVLLNSHGPYARYLLLVMALEKGRNTLAAELAASQGIDYAALEPARLAAFKWAQAALGFAR